MTRSETCEGVDLLVFYVWFFFPRFKVRRDVICKVLIKMNGTLLGSTDNIKVDRC